MQENVTFRNGYWFMFDDGPNAIAVFNSAWSGKQKVFFNEGVVAEGRNLTGFNSILKFTNNDHQYEVRYLTTSILKAEIECLLIKDDHVIGSASKAFYGNNLKLDHFLIGFFGAGFAIGALMVIAKVFLF